MIRINGKEVEYKEGITMYELLSNCGYDMKRIAVECDGEIIPKATLNDVIVKDGITLEVVSFVGGG